MGDKNYKRTSGEKNRMNQSVYLARPLFDNPNIRLLPSGTRYEVQPNGSWKRISAKEQIISCRRKIRYCDEVTARAAVSLICEHMKLQRQYVYKCHVCRGWHASKKHQGRRGRVTKDELYDQRKQHE